MKNVNQLFKRYLVETSGSTAIEYSLIAGVMGLMLIPAMQTLAPQIEAQYTAVTGLFD
jgi:Flp pilus assembly pilin Flp